MKCGASQLLNRLRHVFYLNEILRRLFECVVSCNEFRFQQVEVYFLYFVLSRQIRYYINIRYYSRKKEDS